MTETLHTRATFVTIERPLIPSPPKDARPYWCYTRTLIFYDSDNNEIWRQEIPEASISWIETMKENSHHDEFDRYGKCEVFWEDGFGWQLRWQITHKHAKQTRKRILRYIEDHHRKHFTKKKGSI